MSPEGQLVEFHKAKTILTKPPAPSFNSHFFSKGLRHRRILFSSKIGFHERTQRVRGWLGE